MTINQPLKIEPPDQAKTDLLVEMYGIVKRFPGLTANDQVDFTVRRGEIHALLGREWGGKKHLDERPGRFVQT